jgi:hypothetical protein
MLWCLASFIFGMTVGSGLMLFVILAGTPIRARGEER